MSILLTIDEREMLLKYGENYTTPFLNLLNRDNELRIKFSNLIDTECGDDGLLDIVNYLFQNYDKKFPSNFLAERKNRSEYLAYIIQFLCAVES